MTSRKPAVLKPTTETATAPKRRRAYLPAAERKRLIIEAAQKVFARSNLQGARTRDIAKAAAVNQATIFEHFDSKEALFQEAVVQPMIEELRGMHERIQRYEAATSLDEAMDLGKLPMQRHLESMIKIFPLFTAAMFSDPELGRKLYAEHIAPLFKMHGEITSGVVKDSLDPELVGVASFGIFFAVAMDRIFKGKTDDLDGLVSQLAQMTFTGFGHFTEKS